jgi:hypothetical protein
MALAAKVGALEARSTFGVKDLVEALKALVT